MENIINELAINDESAEIHMEEKIDDTKSQTDDQTEAEARHVVESHRSVTAIMQELQKELDRPIVEVLASSRSSR